MSLSMSPAIKCYILGIARTLVAALALTNEENPRPRNDLLPEITQALNLRKRKGTLHDHELN